MFAERLKHLRMARNLTQEDLANYLGITRQGFGMYERTNTKHEPDHETTIKIADYFGVSTDYLLGRTDYPFNDQKLSLSAETLAYIDFVSALEPSQRKEFELRMLEYADFLKGKVND